MKIIVNKISILFAFLNRTSQKSSFALRLIIPGLVLVLSACGDGSGGDGSGRGVNTGINISNKPGGNTSSNDRTKP